jgi:hypothetical protein
MNLQHLKSIAAETKDLASFADFLETAIVPFLKQNEGDFVVEEVVEHPVPEPSEDLFYLLCDEYNNEDEDADDTDEGENYEDDDDGDDDEDDEDEIVDGARCVYAYVPLPPAYVASQLLKFLDGISTTAKVNALCEGSVLVANVDLAMERNYVQVVATRDVEHIAGTQLLIELKLR